MAWRRNSQTQNPISSRIGAKEISRFQNVPRSSTTGVALTVAPDASDWASRSSSARGGRSVVKSSYSPSSSPGTSAGSRSVPWMVPPREKISSTLSASTWSVSSV